MRKFCLEKLSNVCKAVGVVRLRVGPGDPDLAWYWTTLPVKEKGRSWPHGPYQGK